MSVQVGQAQTTFQEGTKSMFALLPRTKQLLMALSVTGVLALGLAAPVGAENLVTQDVTAGTVTAIDHGSPYGFDGLFA